MRGEGGRERKEGRKTYKMYVVKQTKGLGNLIVDGYTE